MCIDLDILLYMKVFSVKRPLEPISKIRLVFRAQVELYEIPPPGARNGEKCGAYTYYVSILNRFATPPWALRLFLR
jgi:hypothetical protein